MRPPSGHRLSAVLIASSFAMLAAAVFLQWLGKRHALESLVAFAATNQRGNDLNRELEQRARTAAQALAAEALQRTELERRAAAAVAAHVRAAQLALDLHRLVEASEHLDAVPLEARGFEWHYLAHRSAARLIEMRAHQQPVYAVAASADGRWLASGGADATVRLWSAHDRASAAALGDLGAAVIALSISARGERVVAATADHRLHVWSPAAGAHASWDVAGGAPTGVAISGNAERVAAACDQGMVLVWDARDHGEIARLLRHQGSANAVALGHDGASAWSGGDDGVIRRWDVASATERAVLRGHHGAVRSVALAPDERHLASGASDERLIVWDAAANEIVQMIDPGRGALVSVACSSTPFRVASGSARGDVQVFDAASADLLATLEWTGTTVAQIALSPDAHGLLIAAADELVRWWDLAGTQPDGVLTIPADENGDGRREGITSLALSDDGSVLVIGAADGAVHVEDVATGAEQATLRGHDQAVASLACDPRASVIVSGSLDGTVRVWDASTATARQTLACGQESVAVVALDRTRARVVALLNDASVRVWDLGTGTSIATRDGPRDRVFALGLSPDGASCCWASAGGNYRVWESATGKKLHGFRDEKAGRVRSLALSADGALLTAAADYAESALRVWRLADTAVQADLPGSGTPRAMAFSPDGKRLAVGTWDGKVQLWDVSSGRLLLSLDRGGAQISCIAFSADGHRLACGGLDGRVAIWDAPPPPGTSAAGNPPR